MVVRRFIADDAPVLGQLMYDSVHQGTQRHYSAAQRSAWMPEPRKGADWLARLQSYQTWVAEDAVGAAGFITLGDDGYLDLAYVRPDLLGTGVALTLYQTLEDQALAQRLPRLYCEASDLARRFFQRRGWRLLQTQWVSANGVSLRSHQMEKMLTHR